MANFCSPASFSCQSSLARKDFGCLDYCDGFYADVLHTEAEGEQQTDLESMEEEYNKYKDKFAKNVMFDGNSFSSGEKKLRR